MTTAQQTITFNTGRQYSAKGQRITATLYDNGIVTFWDHDRMIDGEFSLGLHCRFSDAAVLDRYDAGTYASSIRSWSDAMQRGGANSSSRNLEAAGDGPLAMPAGATWDN